MSQFNNISIQGKRARLLSVDYQSGVLTFEFDDEVPDGYSRVMTMTFDQLSKVRDPLGTVPAPVTTTSGYWGGMPMSTIGTVEEPPEYSGYWGDLGPNVGQVTKCDCGSASVPGLENCHATWCSINGGKS